MAEGAGEKDRKGRRTFVAWRGVVYISRMTHPFPLAERVYREVKNDGIIDTIFLARHRHRHRHERERSSALSRSARSLCAIVYAYLGSGRNYAHVLLLSIAFVAGQNFSRLSEQ